MAEKFPDRFSPPDLFLDLFWVWDAYNVLRGMADNSIQPAHYNFYFNNFRNLKQQDRQSFIRIIQLLENERYKILKKREKK